MPRYIRADTPGATYFFTVVLADRRMAWLAEHVDLLRDAVSAVKRRHEFHIDAMVVLPDHLHALWTLPPDDAAFARRWMLVKLRFARELRRRLQSPGVEVWQKRYWEHRIRDDRDFENHVNYIHFNPVKHGWARRAADWPHSSFHRYVREGRLPADWGLSAEPEGRFGE